MEESLHAQSTRKNSTSRCEAVRGEKFPQGKPTPCLHAYPWERENPGKLLLEMALEGTEKGNMMFLTERTA